jgi:primosomal protein N' (replication factor Y)
MSTAPKGYADIAVNVPGVQGNFHYRIPPGLRGLIQTGQLVKVPFGRQTVQGIVLGTLSSPEVPKTRDILEILDPIPVLTPAQIALGEHLAATTLSPLGVTLHAMLPAGLSVRVDIQYSLTEIYQERIKSGEPLHDDLTPAQLHLIQLLQERGALRGRQLARALPHRRWRATAGALERRGLISGRSILRSPSASPKKETFARLVAEQEKIQDTWNHLARSGYPEALARRQKILSVLLEAGEPQPSSVLYRASGGSLADLKQLSKQGLIQLQEDEVLRDPLADLDPGPPRPVNLTLAQNAAWKTIQTALDENISRPHLLYGVTGSGKTEIYLRAVDYALERGEQAIILVPEIALTPQTVQRFYRRFPDRVGVLHSRLSEGERFDTWRLARSGDLSIVVGPRSALFTPFQKPGLIVLDECHDDSYYQAEPAPRYHAVRAAEAYARITGAVCILGSATPNVTSTYRAARGTYNPLSLPERILAHRGYVDDEREPGLEHPPTEDRGQKTEKSRFVEGERFEGEALMMDLPPVEVVDMRRELTAGNRSIFSRSLQQELERVLNANQQAILFLNRRGSASYVFCRECGEALRCPRCDRSLTYHRGDESLRCHHCGYQRKMPQRCPSCGSDKIRQLGTGTEQVERVLKELHPGIRTLRWDRDTTHGKNAHWEIMDAFAAHKADVLIGTQMLAKGLDLPLVTLVGVVLAEMGLHLPDYRANERAFQVLTQVAGRAGRSPLGGAVILQTFQPEHYVIQAASRHDYRDFYAREIQYRRELGYPPYREISRLELRDPDRENVVKKAQKMAADLRSLIADEDYSGTELIGPVPCYFERIRGQYRWQILLRGSDPAAILRRHRPGGDWIVEVDPPSIL